MVVKPAELERILTRDIAAFSAFLVFGADVGLVSERIRRIVKAVVDDPSDPFQLVRLSGDELARDTPRLADEAQTVPLFGGRRAVLVEAGTKNIAPAVELFLATPSPSPVVIEAGALKPDAPLRKAIERSKRAAAIECFPDGEREVGALIDGEVAAAGITIEPEARAMLAALLGADRLASRSEVAKLLLYVHGSGTITVEDVEAAVADASAQASDNALIAAFSGETAALDDAIQRMHLNAVDAGQLLGAALRYATLLHRSKLRGTSGGGGAPFRGGLSRRLTDKVEGFAAALSADMLGRAIIRLGESIGQARRDPRLAGGHATRALWAVAQAARAAKQRGA